MGGDSRVSYPKVIGIMGKMGSGKDTIADYLVERYGYTKVSFSELLRDELCELLWKYADIPFNELEVTIRYDFREYNIPDEIVAAMIEGVWSWPACGDWLMAKNSKSRALQQWYGTEYRRAQEEHYWIKLWMTNAIDLGFIGKDKRFVISSVRFENEALFSKSLGELIYVYGREIPNEGIKDHTSEQLPTFQGEFCINNCGSLEDLYEHIDKFIEASTQGD